LKANTKILSLVMSVIMLVACTVTVCSAENNIEDLPEGNFTFVPTDPRERINSDGSFTQTVFVLVGILQAQIMHMAVSPIL